MLMVSELLDLAAGNSRPAEVTARSPARFQADAGVPSVVVWNVCAHCNMKCPHCYAAATSRPSKQELSTDEGRRLIEQLAGVGVRFLIFSGGEPLMRSDLLELLAHAKACGLTPQLSTNGVLLDRPKARALADAGVAYVGISIDGQPLFNDAYRGLDRAFLRAVAGLRHARGAGLRTGLRMTVTNRNADQLPALVEYARSIPVDRFYVSHLVYSGRARRIAGDDLAPERSRELLEDLFALADHLRADGEPMRIVTGGNDSGGPALVQWVMNRYGVRAASDVRATLARRGGNSAGERLLCVDHRGRVHPDQFWRSVTLGDVRRQSLTEILAHPLLGELRGRAARLHGRCGGCALATLCRGSHRERAFAATGDIWASDPACVMKDAEVTSETLEAIA